MKAFAMLVGLLMGCATADVAPPCIDVGCADTTGLCTRDGRCACPQPDGDVIECRRAPSVIHPDAGIDAAP